MKKAYKVDFLPTTDQVGKTVLTRYEKPIDGLEVANRLEALLLERAQEDYKLSQVIKHKRTNPMTQKTYSGLLVIFEEKK